MVYLVLIRGRVVGGVEIVGLSFCQVDLGIEGVDLVYVFKVAYLW